MCMGHQLGRTRGTAGMEVGRDVGAGYFAAAGQALGGEGGEQFVEAVDAPGFVIGAATRAANLQDHLEAGHQAANTLHLVPDIGARSRPQRDQHLGVGSLQDFG